MCVDITNYPELIKVLVDIINVPYDQLQDFKIKLFDSEPLISAYIEDADQGEIEAILKDADIHAELALSIKDRMSADSSIVTVENILKVRIYDIAQEMGPILEQIERENFEAGE